MLIPKPVSCISAYSHKELLQMELKLKHPSFLSGLLFPHLIFFLNWRMAHNKNSNLFWLVCHNSNAFWEIYKCTGLVGKNQQNEFGLRGFFFLISKIKTNKRIPRLHGHSSSCFYLCFLQPQRSFPPFLPHQQQQLLQFGFSPPARPFLVAPTAKNEWLCCRELPHTAHSNTRWKGKTKQKAKNKTKNPKTNRKPKQSGKTNKQKKTKPPKKQTAENRSLTHFPFTTHSYNSLNFSI